MSVGVDTTCSLSCIVSLGVVDNSNVCSLRDGGMVNLCVERERQYSRARLLLLLLSVMMMMMGGCCRPVCVSSRHVKSMEIMVR